MRCLVILCCGVAVVLATDKNDNVDVVTRITNNKRLKSYVLCFLEKGQCTPEGNNFRKQNVLPRLPKPQISSNVSTKKRLAILVPFRDRFDELLEFVPHMYRFLNKQKIPFHIFIIQQSDSYRFNRASLINIGFLYTKKDYDYIAMHDVDLLPLNDNLKYDYPVSGPVHISSPETHPNYNYDTFLGGILLVKNEHFEMVKGMSNNYWGWGYEDDELHVRLQDAGLAVRRLENITTGIENTFIHDHHDNSYRRQRDKRDCFNQRVVTGWRDRVTGLHDVNYTVKSVHVITVDSLPVTVLSVQLTCDQNKTPWCQCPEPGRRQRHRYSYHFVPQPQKIVEEPQVIK